MTLSKVCSCCQRTITVARGIGYCGRCRRHQVLHALIVCAVAAGGLWLGPRIADAVFSRFPTVSLTAHAGLVFALTACAPLILIGVSLLFSSGPEHGHWGSAVSMTEHHTRYRNRNVGSLVAESSGGAATVRDVWEPRCGWGALLLLAFLVPGFVTVGAWARHDDRWFSLYVDNARESAISVQIEGGPSLGQVPADAHVRLRVPRSRLTLVANTESGDVLDRLSVGGLEDIFADVYPNLFPDVEHDTADRFVWNVDGQRCYTLSRKMYGSFALGGNSHVLRERAFAITTSRPFEPAPSSVRSVSIVTSRQEILRTRCR